MNSIYSLVAILLLTVVTGCAAGLRESSVPSARETALQAQIDELKRQLAGQPSSDVTTETEEVVPAPAMGEYYAVVGHRPPGCPNDLTVKIQTADYGVDLAIDGIPVVAHGAGGIAFPLIPARVTAYVCLQEAGEHEIMGFRYHNRNRQYVPDTTDPDGFHFRVHYSSVPDYHVMVLDAWKTRYNEP